MVDKSIAITGLLAAIAPRARVYLVARSRGLERSIVDVVVVDDDRAIVSIGNDVATLCELIWSQEFRGIVCGTPGHMDVVIRAVGCELFGDDHQLRIEWL